MLFDESTVYPISPLFQAERKPAAFRHQLQVYAKTLFNAEATIYHQCAKDQAELREWLIYLVPRIKSDAIQRLQPFTAIHDFHCTAEQRSEAIDEALRECVELQTSLFSPGSALNPPDELPIEKLRVSRKRTAQFPYRAAWLHQRLVERGWDHNDLPKHGGPDRKTVLKVLARGEVNPDVLEKLAKSLSFSKKAAKVTVLDIPTT
jgi:hypothetical protein